jgi:hypothetical protein
VDLWGFVAFFVWMVLLILLSFLTDHLLARVFSQGAHRAFVGVGVVVHELSHWTVCKLTWTTVTEVSFFEESGGHVTHEKRGPLVTSLISMAPLFGCSLFILFLVWLFAHANVYFELPALSGTDFAGSFTAIFTSTWHIFRENVWVRFGWTTAFFLLLLYLVGSTAACIAPSGVDLKHALLGLVILFALGLAAISFTPMHYLRASWGTPVIDWVVGHMLGAIGIGLVGVVIFLIPLSIAAALKR